MLSLRLYVNKWVSARAWILKDNSYAAYVFNHRTNEFLEFEGFAAKLWQYILDNRSYAELLDFAKQNNFSDELDDFLKELSDIGLLTLDNNDDDKTEYIRKQSCCSYIDGFLFSEKRSKILNNGFLTDLFLELNYNCNLKCIHCYNDKSLSEQIEFKEIKPVIDEAYKLGVFSLTLSGGECTLNKDFIKICEYIRGKRLLLQFFTNGQSLYDDKNLFNKVISLYPHMIALSLYSMKPEIHEKITGVKGSHHKTLSVIKKLRENNVNVRINCFLTKYNAYEYKDVEIFANKHKMTFLKDHRLFPNPSKSNYHCEVTPKQLLDCFCYYKNITETERRICNIGNTIMISPDLNVYPCSAYNVLLGNLKNTSLESICKNENSELQKLKALKDSDLNGCNKYDYCRYCVYRICVARSDGYSLESYPKFCEEAKIRMKAAKLCGVCSDLHK